MHYLVDMSHRLIQQAKKLHIVLLQKTIVFSLSHAVLILLMGLASFNALAQAIAFNTNAPEEKKAAIYQEKFSTEFLAKAEEYAQGMGINRENLSEEDIAKIKEYVQSKYKAGASWPDVLQRLETKLNILKDIVARAEGPIEIQSDPIEKNPHCDTIWYRLSQTKVPAPETFANTTAAKKALFNKLRSIVYKNRESYFARGNKVVARPGTYYWGVPGQLSIVDGNIQNQEDYEKEFNNLWRNREILPEISIRENSTHLLFADSLGDIYQHPVFSVLLIDEQYGDLSFDTYMLASDGLLFRSYAANDSHGTASGEWLETNGGRINTTAESGLLQLDHQIVAWSAYSRGNIENHMYLMLWPVWDPNLKRPIGCKFKFIFDY